MNKLFVMRDFEIKGIGIALEDVKRRPPRGFDEVIIPGLVGAVTQGQIFDHAVRGELERATHVLAFVDLPNANVGFELGYALGLGKPVALARVGADIPVWLREPPLAGYLVPPARSAAEIRALVEREDWINPPTKPARNDKSLFVCPEDGIGSSLHDARRAKQADWAEIPHEPWSLADLSRLLNGIGTLVWCLTPYASGTDQRDGRENAADAIVAGFASAVGISLRVLRHVHARPVADLQQWEKTFATLVEFESHLATNPQASHSSAPTTTRPIPTASPPAISKTEQDQTPLQGDPEPVAEAPDPQRREHPATPRRKRRRGTYIAAAAVIVAATGAAVYLNSEQTGPDNPETKPDAPNAPPVIPESTPTLDLQGWRVQVLYCKSQDGKALKAAKHFKSIVETQTRATSNLTAVSQGSQPQVSNAPFNVNYSASDDAEGEYAQRLAAILDAAFPDRLRGRYKFTLRAVRTDHGNHMSIFVCPPADDT